MKQLVKWIFLGLGSGFALSCGGGSSGGRVDTGLPEATVLRDLTASDSVSACQHVRSAIQAQFTLDDNVRRVCQLYGAALTDTSADCQAQADACVTQTNSGTNTFFKRDDLDFAASLSCDGDVSGFAGCDLTVGEYEKCLDARMDLVEQLFTNFSCAQAASIGTADAQNFVQQLTHPETPAACTRLQTECPQAGPFAGAD
jgi:heat shock protein HslJ